VLPATEVQLTNLSRFDISGSGLGISSDGSTLAIGGDGTYDMYFNLMTVDTGLMFTDPMHAVVESKVIENGAATQGLTVAAVDLTPPNSAPTVNGEQGSIINDKDTEITISGTNFMDGALVRVSKLPALVASVDNGGSLRVTVPANVPSDPAADIVVTNPELNGGLDQQYQSGALQGGFGIGLNPAFQPQEQFAFLNGKNYSTVSLFDLKQRQLRTLTAAPYAPLNGIAFSSDGAELFGAVSIILTAWDTENGQQRGSQLALGGNSGSRLPILSENSPLTGKPVIYVAVATYSRPYNIVLKIVDAERNSPNFNTVIGQISTGQNFGSQRSLSSEVATPDGRYVYVPYYYYDTNNTQSHLAIFDVVNNTATVVDLDKWGTYGTNQFQSTITPDGKYLVLRGSRFSYPYDPQLAVLDIATNPKHPKLVGAVSTPRAWRNGIYPPDLFSYRIVGGHLFALSHFSNSLMVFNFNPGNNDYRPYRLYKLPGNSNYQSTLMAVSPDGAFLYVASNADNMVSVLDTNSLVRNQDPLITTIASTDTTVVIAASPVPPPPVNVRSRPPAHAVARH